MNVILKRLIMTRPYSWVGVISVAVMANVAATGSLVMGNALLFDIITAFVIWHAATSMVEFFHGKIDGRGLTSPLVPAISMAILAVILVYRNPLTLLFLVLIVLSDLIYSMKIRDWFLSGFSFIFRGILEASTFCMILIFNGIYNPIRFLPVVAAIFLVTNSRNLVGDIRDVEFDRYTFPRRYGTKASYVVSIILLLISVLLVPNILVVLPFLLFMPVMLVYRNAYDLHRIFVLVTTFFYINYIVMLINQSLVITNLLFIAALLNFTYPLVPRKSNPKGVKFYSYSG